MGFQASTIDGSNSFHPTTSLLPFFHVYSGLFRVIMITRMEGDGWTSLIMSTPF